MCSLFSPLLYLPYIQPLIHAYKYNCIQSATSDCCTTDEGEDGNAAADDDNSDDGKTFRITIKEVFPQTKTQVHDKDRWSPTHKSVKSILLLLSYHRGIVDVVVTKKKRVFLLISTWSGKSMTHHHLPWETCTCTAAINNGRRIPIDHKGESLLCAYVGLQVCKPVHMCYYPFIVMGIYHNKQLNNATLQNKGTSLCMLKNKWPHKWCTRGCQTKRVTIV